MRIFLCLGRWGWLLACLVVQAASEVTLPDAPWRQLGRTPSSAAAPFARGGHSATYCDGGLVVFGGRGPSGELYNDVWRWDLASAAWARMVLSAASEAAPRARAFHSAVCAGSELLVFGGSCGTECVLEDIYQLAAAGPAEPMAVTWTQRLSSAASASRGTPEPRAGHGAVWQPGSNRMLVFGGQILAGAALLDDVWALSTSTSWTLLSAAGAAGAPGGRRDSGIGLLGASMVVYGGWQGNKLLGDFWEFDSGARSWTALENAPHALRGPAVASEPDGKAIAVFGGAGFLDTSGSETDSDTVMIYSKRSLWELPANGVGSVPPTRRASAAVWLPAGTLELVVFGGERYTTAWYFMDI